MSDDKKIRLHRTKADDAFCARMRKAIAAGLESAPICVITTPGTQNPKYFLTEDWPLASSAFGDMKF